MSQSTNHEKMERGREASALEALLRPYINEQIHAINIQMASAYRGQTLTEHFMVGKIAEITTYMNILSNLESAQRQGDNAARKEIGNAT